MCTKAIENDFLHLFLFIRVGVCRLRRVVVLVLVFLKTNLLTHADTFDQKSTSQHKY